MLEVFVDGACEPINPGGTASYGVVVYEGKARLWTKSAIVGSGDSMSNNVGEYSGLLAFLGWYIHENKNQGAIVKSDSQMLVNQMSGRWEARRGLYIPYYNNAWNLIRAFELYGRFNYLWIPREDNWEADDLSKRCLLSVGVRTNA